MATPINPDMKKRKDRDAKGEASATIMRADEKAEDQIRANKSPMPIARMSMPAVLCILRDLFPKCRPAQAAVEFGETW
ncbi:MAG: hypothetical protein ABJN01_11545 [Sulfitobacter sp.]